MELTDPMIDAVHDQEETVRQLQVTLEHAQEQLERLKRLKMAAKVLGSHAIDLHVDLHVDGCTPGLLTDDDVFVPGTGDSPTLTVSGPCEFETPPTASVLETQQPPDKRGI